MDPDLQQALETLHDFREFVLQNATQWYSGAAHNNPMWARVAEVLDRHGHNTAPGRGPTSYIRYEKAYFCRGQ